VKREDIKMIDAHTHTLGALETFFLNITILFVMGGLILEVTKNKKYSLDFALFITILFATIGRILLVPIPNVQPVTTLVLLIGIFMGYKRAILGAFSIALLSNMILGNGPWTIYQGVSWALIGSLGALYSEKLLKNNELQMSKLILIGAISGVLFNWVVSLSVLSYIGYDQFVAFIISGFFFDLYHMVGNVFFIAWLSQPFQNFVNNDYTPTMANPNQHKILKGDTR
jgi:energy-coupling factor transport system substrate-specific component